VLRRIVVILIFAPIAALSAQVGRSRVVYADQPSYWVGLSSGFLDGTTITDGETGATWQFGYTSQIRATFEKNLQRGFSAGVSAAFANAPLNYSGGTSECFGTCQATADVTQYMAFVHGGGGTGFHGIYNLEAGFTEFSNFRENSTNVQLPPNDPKYDFSFGFGGGLGYGFSPTMEAYAGEMFDFVLHPQGTAINASAPRVLTFRVGMRVGF
jgi:hypothetical protein